MTWVSNGDTIHEDHGGDCCDGLCHPVFVIDPEDREAVERLVDTFRRGIARSADGTGVDAMQDALREFANPKPPKPDEPTGRYAVVEDSAGQEWCRIDVHNGYAWQKLGQPATEYHYDMYRNIDAVKVLSPGVTE